MKKRSRAYIRFQRRQHIDRKKRIIHKLNDYWHYNYEGELSKGKIHCSCPMCRQKTNNKHRKVWWQKGKNWKHSDKRNIEAMDAAITEYMQHEPEYKSRGLRSTAVVYDDFALVSDEELNEWIDSLPN